MAMETCFQVSTIASTATPTTTRASYLHSHKEKRSKRAFLSPWTSTSPSFKPFPSTGRNGHGTQFICKAKNAVDEVLAVDDASWNNLVIENATPVVVEFWAPWCGPCRMIAPVIDELVKDYAGKISCYKVNTDNCPNIASKYGVRSIPTVLFFKNGEKKDSVIGAVPKSTLCATIEKYY